MGDGEGGEGLGGEGGLVFLALKRYTSSWDTSHERGRPGVRRSGPAARVGAHQANQL